MTLLGPIELENTKRKLHELEGLIAAARLHSGSGRDAEVRSLSRLAKQLREEIILAEAHAAPRK